jgi:omega-amidase
MNEITIAVLQADLIWEKKVENIAFFDEKLKTLLDKKIDVIILPEMFTTGFSMKPELWAEKSDRSETLAWMLEKATMLDAAICGSFMVAENGHYYNRLYWVQPDGAIFKYDKRHLFGLAKENEHYTAGTEKLIVTWRDWRICPLICYDLRFPVWSRNVENYDLLIYVANWPIPRVNAWKTLLMARAIENQSYCVGVNRVGTDGNGMYHSGESSVVDFQGHVLYQKKDEEDTFLITLNKESQANFRQKFPFLEDKDIFLTKF